MFIETNDRIINLENVSNINILKHMNRIVFNMNYHIQIHGKNTKKLISDYVYWDAENNREFYSNLEKLQKSEFFNCEFIKKPKDDGFINVSEISSIKFIEEKCRVIFNLSHPVTFYDNRSNEKITSEFIYVNCDNNADYLDYVDYIHRELGL